jgi:hypothetical protein
VGTGCECQTGPPRVPQLEELLITHATLPRDVAKLVVHDLPAGTTPAMVLSPQQRHVIDLMR